MGANNHKRKMKPRRNSARWWQKMKANGSIAGARTEPKTLRARLRWRGRCLGGLGALFEWDLLLEWDMLEP